MQVWRLLTKECMSDESDNEDGTKTRHSPKWRSERRFHSSCVFRHDIMFYSLSDLNTFICKLDERNKKKLGSRSDRCVSRVYGEPLDTAPPKPLPQWMVTPEFQHHSESPRSQESSDPSTPVGSGTLPSAQTPTNTDSLYGPMCTPSSSDSVYGSMYTFDFDVSASGSEL